MSSSTSTPIERLVDRAPTAEGYGLHAATRAAAFWLAVLLPLSYGPIIWGGITGVEGSWLLGLLLLNVAALVAGHGHRAPEAPSSQH